MIILKCLVLLAIFICFTVFAAESVIRIIQSGIFSGLRKKTSVEDAEFFEDYYDDEPDECCVYDIESFQERIKELKEQAEKLVDDDGLYDIKVTPSPTSMTGVEIPKE